MSPGVGLAGGRTARPGAAVVALLLVRVEGLAGAAEVVRVGVVLVELEVAAAAEVAAVEEVVVEVVAADVVVSLLSFPLFSDLCLLLSAVP